MQDRSGFILLGGTSNLGRACPGLRNTSEIFQQREQMERRQGKRDAKAANRKSSKGGLLEGLEAKQMPWTNFRSRRKKSTLSKLKTKNAIAIGTATRGKRVSNQLFNEGW